jgi:hypothetical protein
MPICRGPACDSTDLIIAHIIPQAFARDIEAPDGANVTLTLNRNTQTNPRGVWDDKILCKSCDGKIGTRYDNHAIEFFRRFQLMRHNIIQEGTEFSKPQVDCDMLCGFALSVLWRASISTRPECTLTLGPYEDEVREVLFGVKPLSSLSECEIMVQRYRSATTDASKINIYPELAPFDALNAYGFSVGGLRFCVKIDPTPLPVFCKNYIINGKNTLRGLFVDFENTLEFRRTIEMVINAEERKLKGKKSP